MAGQGIERREVLRIMSMAAAAAAFPGFHTWAFACGQAGAANAEITSASYRPLFFSPAEYALVDQLIDLIIPNDGTPGARDAGVAEFIDFMVASDPTIQYAFRTGLTWLNAHSERASGKKFLELTPDGQTDLLKPLAYKDKFRAGEEDGRVFFQLVREYTVMGFYTSAVGYRALDNPALKFYADSPECPHQDDPEHRHLPPPRV